MSPLASVCRRPALQVSAQIRWQCRRGMLEIDLMLADFLERGYAELDAAGAASFEALLRQPDTQLLEWLMGRERPTDGELAHVIERIRAAAAHRAPSIPHP